MNRLSRLAQVASAVALFFCAVAYGQTNTTVGLTQPTASNLKIGGFKISTGTVTFTPVDLRGIPLAFADYTGAQNGPESFECQVTAGAIGGALTESGSFAGTCTVPDSALTVPANIDYEAQVCDTSTGLVTSGKCYTLQSIAGITGLTWPLDHYGPPAQTSNVQTVQFAQGPTTPSSCLAPYFFTNTTTDVVSTCIGGTYVAISTSGSGTGIAAYNAGTSYSVGQLVLYNNVGYIATVSTTGNLPTNTAYWAQLWISPNALNGSTGRVPCAPTTNPSAGHILTADGSGCILDGGTNASAISMPNPGSSLIAEYDFHEGSGTTVDNIAPTGSGYNWTLTSGTPTGAVTPPWISGAVGGAGLAMGTDLTNYYGLGLPSTSVGTSCQTIPVPQNTAKTVLIQFYNPPAASSYAGTFILQDLLGSATGGTGQRYYFYQFANIDVANNNGTGFALSNYQNAVGLHTFIITYPVGTSPISYLDGLPITAANGAPTLYANSFQLGCNGSLQASGAAITAPDMVYHLAFWSTQLTAAQAQQATQFVQTNLAVTKSYSIGLTPFQGNGSNLLIASGDSTTSGIDGGGTASLYPYAVCMVTGTSGCYSSAYATALPAVNGLNWNTQNYGMPGAGSTAFPYQIALREAVYAGDSNGLRVDVIWSGINGLSATEAPPCSFVQTANKYGFQTWLMTLYSVNTTASADQASRDPYNAAMLRSAKGCGAVGLINVAEDAYLGVDGHQGTSPYWATANVHLGKTGYAYVAQIATRVLSNFYLANMNVPTVYSASTVTMNGYDRFVTWNTASNAIAGTLPDCIGMGGSGIPYLFKVSGSNSLTLSAASVTGQTETINGTTSQVFPSGNYKLVPQTLITATSNSGGCDWEVVP